jgi:outer membrane protein
MPNSFRSFRLPAALAALTLMGVVSTHAQPAPENAAQATASAPLTLASAIHESMSKSEEALILQEKQRKFKALKREAWSGGYPQVTANANVGRGATAVDPSVFGIAPAGGGSPGVFNIEQNRFAWDIEVQQSIFSFGRLSQVIHVAGIQDNADAASRRRSYQQLQLQVLDAYYAMVNSRARLQTLEASMKRAQETQAFLESNFKMGSGLRSGVLRALTALKALEPERIRANRDAEAARMALNRILGREVDAPLELDTSAHLDLAPMGTAPDNQALQTVLDERPDLKSLELNRQSLQGQAKYMRMQYLPSLGAQGKYGITAFKLRQLGDIEQNHEWQIGLGLRWPLFDGFSFAAKAQQMESEARSLGLTARQMRKLTQVEIESAYRDYQATDTAQAAAEQAVQAAQEAQAMLSEDFRAGKGQLTDLLDAEQALREATLGVLNARYASVRSRAALRLAMGKGLINEEIP